VHCHHLFMHFFKMFPLPHLILSVIPFIFVALNYGWISIFFWLGAVFVDFDHYIWYIMRKKDFSLKKAYEYGKKSDNNESYLHIFHTVEFWILIGIWAMYSKLIFMIVLGLSYHLVLDFIYIFYKKAYFARNLSYFMWVKNQSPSKSIKLKA